MLDKFDDRFNVIHHRWQFYVGYGTPERVFLEFTFDGEFTESVNGFTDYEVITVRHVVVVGDAFDDAKALF